MAYSESYTCDVCGKQKAGSESWWLAWIDCLEGRTPGEDQSLIKLTRWQVQHAHSAGVKHLCGALCTGTMMDRWMSDQHENPETHCESASVRQMPEPLMDVPRKAVGFTTAVAKAPPPIEMKVLSRKDE